jgi:hypothetical protein
MVNDEFRLGSVDGVLSRVAVAPSPWCGSASKTAHSGYSNTLPRPYGQIGHGFYAEVKCIAFADWFDWKWRFFGQA